MPEEKISYIKIPGIGKQTLELSEENVALDKEFYGLYKMAWAKLFNRNFSVYAFSETGSLVKVIPVAPIYNTELTPEELFELIINTINNEN